MIQETLSLWAPHILCPRSLGVIKSIKCMQIWGTGTGDPA